MTDSDAVRSLRRRKHQAGDHQMCRPDRCGEAAKVAAMTQAEQSTGTVSTALVDAYRRRLEAAGRVDSPEGQHVLRLAEAMGQPSLSASGMASLSRALQAAMDAAMAGARAEPDWTDEVAERRRRKFAGL